MLYRCFEIIFQMKKKINRQELMKQNFPLMDYHAEFPPEPNMLRADISKSWFLQRNKENVDD
jgi:hypothetical protein